MQIVLFDSDIRAMPRKLREELLDFLLRGNAAFAPAARMSPQEARLVEGLAELGSKPNKSLEP